MRKLYTQELEREKRRHLREGFENTPNENRWRTHWISRIIVTTVLLIILVIVTLILVT